MVAWSQPQLLPSLCLLVGAQKQALCSLGGDGFLALVAVSVVFCVLIQRGVWRMDPGGWELSAQLPGGAQGAMTAEHPEQTCSNKHFVPCVCVCYTLMRGYGPLQALQVVHSVSEWILLHGYPGHAPHPGLPAKQSMTVISMLSHRLPHLV